MKKSIILTIALIFLVTISSNAQMVAAKLATEKSNENKKELVVKEKDKKVAKGFNFNKSNKYLKKESCSSSDSKKSCCSKKKEKSSSTANKATCSSDTKKQSSCASSEKASCSSDNKKDGCCSSKKIEECSSSTAKTCCKSKEDK